MTRRSRRASNPLECDGTQSGCRWRRGARRNRQAGIRHEIFTESKVKKKRKESKKLGKMGKEEKKKKKKKKKEKKEKKDKKEKKKERGRYEGRGTLASGKQSVASKRPLWLAHRMM